MPNTSTKSKQNWKIVFCFNVPPLYFVSKGLENYSVLPARAARPYNFVRSERLRFVAHARPIIALLTRTRRAVNRQHSSAASTTVLLALRIPPRKRGFKSRVYPADPFERCGLNPARALVTRALTGKGEVSLSSHRPARALIAEALLRGQPDYNIFARLILHHHEWPGECGIRLFHRWRAAALISGLRLPARLDLIFVSRFKKKGKQDE